MDKDKLTEILLKHQQWLNGEDGGERADLTDADLWGADLRRTNLRRTNLRDADLTDADLRDADLRDADLTDADLRYANLRGADLTDANLRDADLTGADLRDADLWGANLWGANLTGADLRRTNLRGANLRYAGLIVIHAPSYTITVTRGHVRIGCKLYTHDEWRNFDDDTIDNMDDDALYWWQIHKPMVLAAMDAVAAQPAPEKKDKEPQDNDH